MAVVLLLGVLLSDLIGVLHLLVVERGDLLRHFEQFLTDGEVTQHSVHGSASALAVPHLPSILLVARRLVRDLIVPAPRTRLFLLVIVVLFLVSHVRPPLDHIAASVGRLLALLLVSHGVL